MMIKLLDVLKLAGFETGLPTKLVRHKDDRYPELRRSNWFELYQAYQKKSKFHGAKQIVSFYGLSGNRAVFYGVYKVLGHRPASDGPAPTACEFSKRWKRQCKFFYDLERDSRYDDLRDRLVIDWGRGALAWVQRLKNKPIAEILPPGRKLPPFTDYLEFSLTYAQLKDLFKNKEAHRDWHTPLRAVAGVYLILAEHSGKMYVGSAYGATGIWGRWRNYAKSGHGGNARLRKLIARSPGFYPDKFRFSILQTLPTTMTRKEVIRRETQYKDKLGTRAMGLNSN
ncbi:MAG: GIY-YIG nuclease family protein [Candidatus Acidiferrales bacterium]